MASGRILKTQISLSEQVNDLPIHAALLFTWMIPHADDFGRLPGSARKIKAQVVPMRDDFTTQTVEECLASISMAQLIERYMVSGDWYIQFPNFEEHQSGLHKRTKSKFPGPELADQKTTIPGNSGKFREIPPEQKRREQEQNRTEQNGATAPAANAPPKKSCKFTQGEILEAYGITDQLATDFIAHRKAKKAAITETAMDGFRREAEKAGLTTEQAVRVCIERGWQGFKAEWMPSATLPITGKAPRYERGNGIAAEEAKRMFRESQSDENAIDGECHAIN